MATVSPLKGTLFIRAFALRYIPMIGYCRPSVIELSEERVEIKIPLTRKTKNHWGSMYFGALAVGADIAGGFLAMHIIRERKTKVSLVFKDFKAEFLKRPMGDVHFISSQGAGIKELVEQAIASGERVSMPVEVTAVVPSESSEPVAKMTVTLSLKKSA